MLQDPDPWRGLALRERLAASRPHRRRVSAGRYLGTTTAAMVGDDVLMVSGSDQHGTPITVRADNENTHAARGGRSVPPGVPPDLLAGARHLVRSLHFDRHAEPRQDSPRTSSYKLLEQGYLYREVQQQLYSPRERRFLPDRYVEGTCPHCGSPTRAATSATAAASCWTRPSS